MPPFPAANQLPRAQQRNCDPKLHTSTPPTLPNPSHHLMATYQRQRPWWPTCTLTPHPHTSIPNLLARNRLVDGNVQRYTSTCHTLPNPALTSGDGHLPAAVYAVAFMADLHSHPTPPHLPHSKTPALTWWSPPSGSVRDGLASTPPPPLSPLRPAPPSGGPSC